MNKYLNSFRLVSTCMFIAVEDNRQAAWPQVQRAIPLGAQTRSKAPAQLIVTGGLAARRQCHHGSCDIRRSAGTCLCLILSQRAEQAEAPSGPFEPGLAHAIGKLVASRQRCGVGRAGLARRLPRLIGERA